MPDIRERLNPTLAHDRSSPRDRHDAGRSRRDSVPLESHAEDVADAERPDPLPILAALVVHRRRLFWACFRRVENCSFGPEGRSKAATA